MEGRGGTAGSEVPTVQLRDLWKASSTASARHNTTSPFASTVLRRNPTTTLHRPIKK